MVRHRLGKFRTALTGAATQISEANRLHEETPSPEAKDVRDAWFKQGTARVRTGDLVGAKTCFERALADNPRSFDAATALADVCEKMQLWREATNARITSINLLAEDKKSSIADEAFSKALIAAYLTQDTPTIASLCADAAWRAPRIFEPGFNDLLRSRLIRATDPARSKELLVRLTDASPRDDAAAFDLATLCLNDGDLDTGITAIGKCLAVKPEEHSFLWLATDLYERKKEWHTALKYCERMIAAKTPEDRAFHRGFETAARQQNLPAARRIALAYTKFVKGELILIDRLRQAYEDAKDFRRARLLCRFLVRRWPHVEWLKGRLAVLTAKTRGLIAADLLIRSLNAVPGGEANIDRAYAEAAYFAGEYSAARERLRWFIGKYDSAKSDGAHILLGYALANCVGLHAAEAHFFELAASTYQSRGSLVGLAHMAARRQDHRAALDLWARVAAMYPDDTIARVEHARAAYRYGDIPTALRLSQDRCELVEDDVTMGEFYVWLLLALGRFAAARNHAFRLIRTSGPSWPILESMIHASGAQSLLDEDWEAICRLTPISSTYPASERLYQIVRLLIYFSRFDLVSKLISRVNIRPEYLLWLHPYRKQVALPKEVAPSAARAWTEVASVTTDGPMQRLSSMNQAEVAALLHSPRHHLPKVHVVNKFEQLRGGSELHALDIAVSLRRYTDVELWAPETPHPGFTASDNVRAVDHSQGSVPYGGTIIIVGIYFSIRWLERTKPNRIILLYNTFEAPSLFAKIQEAFTLTGVRPEIVFASDLMKEECGLGGFFEISPTDIDLFKPVEQKREGPFKLGRHSRDVFEKHHPDDRLVYEAVTALGGNSEVLGGRCMSSVFGPIPNLNLMPAKTKDIEKFLQQLDVYYYRTSTWIEPWGRVVVEAMACGLPVVAHYNGGYAQIVKHKENGFLFEDASEAVELVKLLHADPGLRRDIGARARSSIERLLGPEEFARQTAFYLI